MNQPLQSTPQKTGRNVTIVTVCFGILGAIAPMVADMDLTSTAGVVAALLAVAPVVIKYLDGWQAYEARLDSIAGGSGDDGPPPAPVIDTTVATAPPSRNGRSNEGPVTEARRPMSDAIDAEPVDVPEPPTDDELEEALVVLTADGDEPDA